MGKTGPNKNNDSCHVIQFYLPFVHCIIFLRSVLKSYFVWTQVPVLTNLNENFDCNHNKTENTSRRYRFL